MTPLEIIKQGIIANDINMVAEGYLNLTGENLLVTPVFVAATEKKKRARPKKEVVKRAKKPTLRKNDIIADDDSGSEEEKPLREARRGGGPRITGKNGFVDDGTLHRADKAIDAKLRPKEFTPRPEAYRPVRINCGGCGRPYEVHPIFISNGTYRCDKCCR